MLELASILALALTGLALVPGGAHLFELSNKMRLDQRDYFVVQSIYRGWQAVGLLVAAALAANLWAATLHRGEPVAFWLFVAAAVLIASTLVVFFIWTLPMNKATQFWTHQSERWRTQRRQWEFSHAASAALTFLALICASAAVAIADREQVQTIASHER